MIQHTELVGAVDTKIKHFLHGYDSILASIGQQGTSFTDYSRYLLSGGKRFRAQVCAWGWQAAEAHPLDHSGDDTLPAELVTLCAALEVFHTAALVHDDIIDKSATRRGMPAVHARFESLHEDSGYAGSAAEFGRAGAILAGDLLLAWSDELVAEALAPLAGTSAAAETRAEFNRMRVEVTVGQYLDILEEHAWPTVSDEDAVARAETVTIFKSAKYSVEAPLVLGAVAAGASADRVAELRAFGLPLGIAFQLRDDVLGVFGDSAVTGKPSGDDLREGKRTILVAFTREHLDSEAKNRFDALLGSSSLDDGDIDWLRGHMVSTGALDRVEAIIEDKTAEAIAAVTRAGLAVETTSGLTDLALRLTQREA